MREPLPDDTRGIIDPAAMMRHVGFERAEPGPILDGLVEWFWTVAWNLPPGVVHDQHVLNHPAGNISVGTLDDAGVPLDPPEGRVYGVMTGLSTRRLTKAGWTVAARTTVGGLGVLLDASAKSATDRQLSLADALPGIDGTALVIRISAEADNPARVDALRRALEVMVERRDRGELAEARAVARVAAVAEHDRSICRIEQLAAHAGTSIRTLQRLFDAHVGVSPSFVIRRWRIIEAADAARTAIEGGESWRGWADVAAELGYADQAHLTRDFRRHVGTSPAAYLGQATGTAGASNG
ncbi:MAG: helix-turn-helix transcriptional regulator [Actinomycetota bacterium]